MKFDEKLMVTRNHRRVYSISITELKEALVDFIKKKTGHVVGVNDLYYTDTYPRGFGCDGDESEPNGMEITVVDEKVVTT